MCRSAVFVLALSSGLALQPAAPAAAQPPEEFRKAFEEVWRPSSPVWEEKTYGVVLGEAVPAAFWYGKDVTLDERDQYPDGPRQAYVVDVIGGEIVDRDPQNASVRSTTLEPGEIVELMGVGYGTNRVDLQVRADEKRRVTRTDRRGRARDKNEPVVTLYRFHLPLDPARPPTAADADAALAYVASHLKACSTLTAAQVFSRKLKSARKKGKPTGGS